jgi:YD repeat-containing protein
MPDPDPIRYKYTFDDDGKLATMTDPSGRVTACSRDGTSLEPNASGYPRRVATYTYDEDGRLIRVQNAEQP